MKNLIKNISITAAIFLGIGVILCIIGLIFGANTVIVYSEENGLDFVNERKELEYINMDMEEFSSVHIECQVAKVHIIPSVDGKYGIKSYMDDTIKGATKIDIKNGKLTVMNKNDGIKISLNPFDMFSVPENEIKIYVPVGITLNDIYVKNEVGEVSINGIDGAKQLQLVSDVGDILVYDGIFEQMDIDQNVGDVNVSKVTVSKELVVSSDVGDINLSGALACNIKVESNVGDVDLETSVSEKDYNYNVSSDVGDVDVFGKSGEININSMDRKYNMNIKTDVGDIDVK